MSAPIPKHFNTVAGAPPYRDLFKKVSIAPAGCSLAFISTQWAADPATGELIDGVANDYGKQATAVWTNVFAMLRELGVTLENVVNFNAQFKDFNDDIGKAVVEGMMAVLPPEWKGHVFKSSIFYRGAAHFHRPGIVYAVDLTVAVPPHA